MSMLSVFSSPGHYVQGRDATAALGREMVRLGLTGPAVIVAGTSAYDQLAGVWKQSLGDAGIGYDIHRFGTECSDQEIARIVDVVRRTRASVVVGAGGGKAIDAARAAADLLDLPAVTCPTIASNDAPCSALSVIYTEDGEFLRYQLARRNPALVLVDTTVIAHAPARLLTAGMGDALATWFEARTCVAGHVRNMRGGASTESAATLAELCYRILLADGRAALGAVQQRAVTPSLERLVEANTLLSGLGFESSGLAAAHAVHNGLTAVPQTHPFLHGEKVAFGVLVMLVLEGGTEIDTVLDFCADVGLPTTLAAVGLGRTDRQSLDRVAERATAEGETIHNEPFEVSPAMVTDAILTADALGREHQLKRTGPSA